MAATCFLRPVQTPSGVVAKFEVVLQGFADDQDVEIGFFEVDEGESLIGGNRVQTLGTLTGKVQSLPGVANRPPAQTVIVDNPPAASKGKFRVAFVFPGSPPRTDIEVVFDVPMDAADKFEGDTWELQAMVNPALGATLTKSPIITVTRVRRALATRPGPATYPWHAGNEFVFYRDGADTSGPNAFADISAAIDAAEHFVFIVDWSFHPYFRTSLASAADPNSTIGAKLVNKCTDAKGDPLPGMLVAIHAWDHTNIAVPDPQSDNADDHIANIAKFLKKKGRPSNLLWRISSISGIGFSHHQKFVLCDAPGPGGRKVLKLFFGGLDLTKGRLDSAVHPILETDPGGKPHSDLITNGKETFDDWYNNELFSDLEKTFDPIRKTRPNMPRQPWHDIYAQVVGPVAWDALREFVGRWSVDPSDFGFSSDGDNTAANMTTVRNKFLDLFNALKPGTKDRLFVQQWEPTPGPWSAQLYRSMKKRHWGTGVPVKTPALRGEREEFAWPLTTDFEKSIQDAQVQAIRQAERHIYIESQYFIGSGSMWSTPRGTVAHLVPKAITDRIIEKIDAKEPFHAYVVVPMFPEGDPGSAVNAAQRQFQWNTFLAMLREIKKKTSDPFDFLSFYFIANWHDLSATPLANKDRATNADAARRYQIYVHSKFMIVDDRYGLIGSANLNERSMAGNRDSEFAIGFWPTTDKQQAAALTQLRNFRKHLWAEHMGTLPPNADDPENPACVKAVRDLAARNYKNFRDAKRPAGSSPLCSWPIDLADPAKPVPKGISGAKEDDDFIPDRPFGLSGNALDRWRWHAPGSHSQTGLGDVTKPGQDIAE
ncbi:MAG: phospholipase D-like domain-containing protein [Phycisphaerales bacterium]